MSFSCFSKGAGRPRRTLLDDTIAIVSFELERRESVIIAMFTRRSTLKTSWSCLDVSTKKGAASGTLHKRRILEGEAIW